MIILEHERQAIKRLRPDISHHHQYSGGTITAAEIAKKIGITPDAVRKRLKTQAVDELLAEGRRPPGLPAGHPNLRNQYSKLNGHND